MKLNQKGFGLIEGLFVVIAITLVVWVSFYIVNTNKKDDKNSNIETSKVTQPESKTTQTQKTEEELIIEAVKKDGAENADGSITPVKTVKVDNIVGNNAEGSAGYGAPDGGYAFIAHKTNGSWGVVFKGQQLPGKDIGEKYNLPSDWYSSDY